MPPSESRKQAAIATLGTLGSGLNKFKRPSSISPKDISAKPLPQKQLGQTENNRFIQQTELLKGPLSANVNKSASSLDVSPYVLTSYIKKQDISVPAYTEQPYTTRSGDVSTTKQADLADIVSKLRDYAPKGLAEAPSKILDASKNLYSTFASGFRPAAGQEDIFSRMGKQVSDAASGLKDRIGGGIEKIKDMAGLNTRDSVRTLPNLVVPDAPAPASMPVLAGPPASLAGVPSVATTSRASMLGSAAATVPPAEMMGPPSSLAGKLTAATPSRLGMLRDSSAPAKAVSAVSERMGPPSSLAGPGQPQPQASETRPSPLAGLKAPAPNPLARPDISPAAVAEAYDLGSPNFTETTTNYGGIALKSRDYDPAALSAFVRHHNRLNPTKPIDEASGAAYLEKLQNSFGPGSSGAGNGASLGGVLEAGNNGSARRFLADDPERPMAEFAHGLNLISMDTPLDAGGSPISPKDQSMYFKKDGPYYQAQQANYDIKNQQMARHFSQLPPEQQSAAVLNMPYARKVDTIEMLKASKDPQAVALAQRMKSLDDSIYSQNASALGKVAMPEFMAGRPVSLMTVLGNTNDSRTFEERVRMLPPEAREKVKSLPPGIISRLRFQADEMTGNRQATAAANSSGAYRQTGIGESDSAWRNFQERAGIGSMAPVGDAVDAVRGLGSLNKKPVNMTLGKLDNLDNVLTAGNSTADMGDRIKGYNQNIHAAIASGDPARINKIPEIMQKRNELLGKVNAMSDVMMNHPDLQLNGPSAMSQAMAYGTPSDKAMALASAVLSDLNPGVIASRALARGAVYAAEGADGLGRYINKDNRSAVGDVLGYTMLPAVNRLAERVSGAAGSAAKATAAAERLARLKNLGAFGGPEGIADRTVRGAKSLASSIYKPTGYGYDGLTYPAGYIANQQRVREKIKGSVSSLMSALGLSGDPGPGPGPISKNKVVPGSPYDMTSLQKSLLAAGVGVPAVMALSASMAPKGSDELPDEEEDA